MRLPIQRNRRDDRADEFSVMPLRSALDQFFEDSFWNPWELMRMPRMLQPGRNGWMPRVDLSETDKEIRVKVNAPGVDPKQINISVEDTILTISGKTEEEREKKGENFYHMEREVGSFQRSLELPAGADTEKIEATSAKGVISIVIPKKPEAQRRAISVKIQDKEK